MTNGKCGNNDLERVNRRPGFESGSSYVGFVLNKAALEQVSS
jgi:hypothetical protein